MKRILCAVLAALLLTACTHGNRSDATQTMASTKSSVSEPKSSSEVSELEKPQSDSLPDKVEVGANSAGASDAGSSGGEMSSEAEPLTVRITIPEGYTLAKIGLLLEEKELCTFDEFMTAAAGDFSEFPLIAARQPNPQRCFALEGYLFPDTYEVYAEETPDAILRRMLSHTESQITTAMRGQIEASGFTVDEIITLASIIEKEAFGAKEMPNISSVLHNRLDADMRLQCDVTIKYVEGAIKPFITGDVNRYNADYNTYKCDGLPAGPICNPGLAAIKAAIEPANTEYYFFLTDKDSNYLYAKTLEEHNVNVKDAGLE